MTSIDAAPPGRWSFLYPWCHLLRGRLHLEGRVVENSSRWEYRWVVVKLPHSPEEASVNTLQRIREALDLLTQAAIADNAAWRVLLVQQCRVPMEEDDQPLDCELSPRFRVVFNEDFMEEGALSPAQVCRRFLMVTPAQRPSEEYLEARRELEQLRNCLHSSESASVPMELQFELVALEDEVLGRHLRDLSAMFEVLQSGRQSTQWSLLPLTMESIRLDVGGFNVGNWALTHRLTALLTSRLPISLFAFSLKRSTAENYAEMQQNMGRFLRAVLCSQSQDEDERRGVETLSVGCQDGDEWQFAALCSALGCATTTNHIRLFGVFRMSDSDEKRGWKWGWLAYALFRSTSTVDKVLLSAAHISRSDAFAIATVLSSNCPPPYRWDQASAAVSRSCEQSGYFTEGTEFLLRDEDAQVADDQRGLPAIVLDVDLWAQVVHEEVEDNSYVDVVLPGFGIARARRSSAKQIEHLELHRCSGLRALTLALGRHSENDGGEVLADFLHVVGARLEFLAIYAVGSYPIGMASICQSCPKLEELFLDGIKLVDAEIICQDADENDSQITRLGLVNSFSTNQQITCLAESIGKPTCRFAEQLSELNVIDDVDEDNVVAILRMLETNKKLTYLNLGASPELYEQRKDDFRRHHEEPIAVVENNFERISKAAFLSVVSHSSGSAVNALDDGVTSLIFSFAATCKTRVVRTHYM